MIETTAVTSVSVNVHFLKKTKNQKKTRMKLSKRSKDYRRRSTHLEFIKSPRNNSALGKIMELIEQLPKEDRQLLFKYFVSDKPWPPIEVDVLELFVALRKSFGSVINIQFVETSSESKGTLVITTKNKDFYTLDSSMCLRDTVDNTFERTHRNVKDLCETIRKLNQ